MRAIDEKEDAGSVRKILEVGGMHCASCETLLNDIISEIPGVKSVSADYKRQRVILGLSNPGAIISVKKAIEKQGYRVLG